MHKHQHRVVVLGAGILAALTYCGARADAVAFWHFDEAPGATVAADSAGTHPGTLFGSAAFVAGGVSGNALSVTRAGNGYVTMGDYFRFVGGDFAVVAWARTAPGDQTPDYFVLAKHRATIQQGYLLGVNVSGAYGAVDKAWFYQSSQAGGEPRSTTSVNDGNWHQIVGVYRLGRYARIFVDGAPYEDSRTAVFIGGNAASFAIGAIDFNGTLQGYFTGWVDEVQLYGHFLTAAQVQYLFEHPSQTVIGPLGDLDCNGAVDFDDINAFVLALSDPDAYALVYPGCNIARADFNLDGAVNFDDINPFVEVLSE